MSGSIRCKSCGKVSDSIAYRGPVLIVEGVATIDERGRISALGPAKAIHTIQIGDELSGNMSVICKKCKREGTIDDFEPVRLCVLSGKEATVEYTTPLGIVWIAADQTTIAASVFTEENARWSDTITLEMLRV